jgi:hypothetical protein
MGPGADLDRWTRSANYWMLTRTLAFHDRFADEMTE